MKLCLVSTTLNQSTGYSKVSYNMLKELLKVPDLELFHYASQSSGKIPYRPELTGIVCKENDDFAFEGLQAFCEEHAVDVVMIYGDVGIVLSYLQKWSPPRLWIYADTVAHGIPPPLLKMMDDKAERIYFLNSYWKNVYPFEKARVLEHGVDPEVFKIEDTSSLRKDMKIPEDAIVFLNANRNSRRKRLDLTISAFVQFCKMNPSLKAYLLLMTSQDGYYNIANVLYNEIHKHRHDCSKRVLSIMTDKQLFTDDAINKFYNLADYGLNTSTGEGYGLTALEHLAVGKPQVLTHLPSYETFVGKKGVVFVQPTGDREYYEKEDYSGSYHETWSAKHIANAMENVLNKKVDFKAKSWSEVMKGFIEELWMDSKLSIQVPALVEDSDNCSPSQSLRQERQEVKVPLCADV